MPRLLIFLISTAFCSALAVLSAHYSLNRRLFQTPSPSIPYTAFRTVTNWDSAGKQQAVRQLIVGKRSNGSYFKYTVNQDGKILNHTTITDFAALKRFVLDVPTKSITTYPISEKFANSERNFWNDQDGKCLQVAGEHASKVGYDSVRVVERAEDHLTPGGTQVDESWQAPVLGCLPLDVTETFKRPNNTVSEIITDRVTKVIEGEPDDTYFARPADYVERTPSEVLQQQVRPPCPQCEANSYTKFDQVYQSAQRRK